MIGVFKKIYIQLVTRLLALRYRTIAAVIRNLLAGKYLSGEGIEIGGLHNPLLLPSGLKVRYLDKMSSDELRRVYPELKNRRLVKVDVVDDGETLNTLADESLDFIIANHFLEHCRNPLRTVGRMYSSLKPGGTLFLTIPDKRYTFDSGRDVTPLEHLLEEYEHGADESYPEHVWDWVCKGLKLTGEAAERKAESLISNGGDGDMHVHCWDHAGIVEMALSFRNRMHLALEPELIYKNGNFETVVILRKDIEP
ncbi:MAG: methyltransferase domain-containing protein [Geobacter sp.]|nr:methyltransferase domain-containing protein [Geobacter sp.]